MDEYVSFLRSGVLERTLFRYFLPSIQPRAQSKANKIFAKDDQKEEKQIQISPRKIPPVIVKGESCFYSFESFYQD